MLPFSRFKDRYELSEAGSRPPIAVATFSSIIYVFASSLCVIAACAAGTEAFGGPLPSARVPTGALSPVARGQHESILGTKATEQTPAQDDMNGASSFPAEVAIPNTRRIKFVSSINGHQYEILVALPFRPAPRTGYRVLYVLDGDALFATATTMVRGRGSPDSDVVIVGIDYPQDATYANAVVAARGPVGPAYRQLPAFLNAPALERAYDLTLPTTEERLRSEGIPGYPLARSAADVGGLDDFLQVIEKDVKPRIASLTVVDSGNEAIFGHSLGGLAVLRALFTEPTVFRTFIASSPSIWWGEKAVLADEAKFSAMVEKGQASPRLLITIGSEESAPPTSVAANSGIDSARLASVIRDDRMVENSAELAARLKFLRGRPPYSIDYAVFDKYVHSKAEYPALLRGIAFAFEDRP